MRFVGIVGTFVMATVGCYNPGDLGSTPYKCSEDFPECPDRYICACPGSRCPRQSTDPKTLNRCVPKDDSMTSALMIPKTNVYPGNPIDPQLDGANCPGSLEPNNDVGSATQTEPNPTMALEICPRGDVDVYVVTTGQGEYAKVSIKYSISSGDLDLGLFDASGNLTAYDSDATRDHACVVTTGSVGAVYATIIGGMNQNGTTDINRYTLKIERSAMRPTCN